jgi:hypothetical protein
VSVLTLSKHVTDAGVGTAVVVGVAVVVGAIVVVEVVGT